MADTDRLSLKAFLSHRYKSPEVNIYFYNLFSQRADVYFDVDLGTVATNVTRLERMIRSCDAFIGIYPYPGEALVAPSHDEKMAASRYFRLELDLAIRSRKPALVFYDRHYGGILQSSRNTRFLEFDSAEILAAAKPSDEGRFRNAFQLFTETIAKSQAYGQLAERSLPTDIGILLPTETDGSGYGSQELTAIRNVLHDQGYVDPRVIRYPPRLDKDSFLLLEGLDWVIADVGDHKASSLVAYMHGRFIPTIRLLKVPPAGRSHSDMEHVLYGGVEVGYSKDIVRWTDVRELEEGPRPPARDAATGQEIHQEASAGAGLFPRGVASEEVGVLQLRQRGRGSREPVRRHPRRVLPGHLRLPGRKVAGSRRTLEGPDRPPGRHERPRDRAPDAGLHQQRVLHERATTAMGQEEAGSAAVLSHQAPPRAAAAPVLHERRPVLAVVGIPGHGIAREAHHRAIRQGIDGSDRARRDRRTECLAAPLSRVQPRYIPNRLPKGLVTLLVRRGEAGERSHRRMGATLQRHPSGPRVVDILASDLLSYGEREHGIEEVEPTFAVWRL